MGSSMQPWPRLDLTAIDGVVSDMDGVLWRGSEVLPGVAAFFGRLRDFGVPFVLATNSAMLWRYASLNRALALPHLLAWVPLQAVLVARLIGGWGPDALAWDEWLLAVLVVMVNSVALFFDTVASWRWWRDRRLNLAADGL